MAQIRKIFQGFVGPTRRPSIPTPCIHLAIFCKSALPPPPFRPPSRPTVQGDGEKPPRLEEHLDYNVKFQTECLRRAGLAPGGPGNPHLKPFKFLKAKRGEASPRANGLGNWRYRGPRERHRASPRANGLVNWRHRASPRETPRIPARKRPR